MDFKLTVSEAKPSLVGKAYRVLRVPLRVGVDWKLTRSLESLF